MRATLRIIAGPAAGRSFVVRRGEACSFGRADWVADIAVSQDGQLAEQHFSFEYTGGECLVRDLGTDSGTQVNGERHLKVAVHDGDVISAGQSEFRLEMEGEPGPPVDAPQTVSVIALPNDAERPYETGVMDDDADVRWGTLEAAAWARQTWLLDYCRSCCATPQPEQWESLRMLALLGEPTDFDRILALARNSDLGPSRFELLGRFGHPGAVDELLIRLESQEPETAAAAGEALERITGFSVFSETAASPPADEDVVVEDAPPAPPDSRLAKTQWQQERNRFVRGTRWCRGMELSRGATVEILLQLDLESRWETRLRDHFHGRRAAAPELFSEFRT